MSHRLPIVLLLAAAAGHAGWMPDSPLLRIGEDVDLYFTARAKVSYDSNLFYNNSAGLPESGTSWTVGPGLSADFFKESMFSSSVSWRRDFVRYFDSALKGLHDDQDVGKASITYDGGGPLTLQLEASYQEDARNTIEQVTLTFADGTLVRQTNYSQSATLGYRFTDKINFSASATHSSNRYDPRPRPLVPGQFNTEGLTESNGWSFPLDLRYQVRERLSIGLAYTHAHTNITPARGSTLPAPYPGFTSDFYGLTLTGQPTDSGKLDVVLKAGVLQSEYDGGADPRTAPSYSVALTHTLTEKTNHSLSFGQNASVAVNGRRNETRNANYTFNYNMSEGFRASAFVGLNLSSVDANANDIRSNSFGLNATLSPDSHWTYSASYAFNRASSTTSYNVQQFTLEANLRW